MFETIVLAYDGSAECRNALQEGVLLAQRFKADCHLLAVVPPPPAVSVVAGPLPEGMLERKTAAMKDILEQGVTNLRNRGLTVNGMLRIWEDPCGAIADYVRETGADLVVVGHHRRSALDRWWRGSVGHSLLDQLPCSLLVSMPRCSAAQADKR
jgi:nucleotide-binding universal stress UspA family protein